MKIMKKSYHWEAMWCDFFTKKTILIMKMNVIILFMTLGELMATNVMTQNITLDIRDEPLSQAITQIEKLTDYHVFYNSKLVDLSQKITVQIQDATLEEALDQLFSSKKIDYLLIKNLIVLFRKGDPDAEKWIETILEANNAPPERQVESRVVPKLTRQNVSLQSVQFNITGQVRDQNGDPLIGVNVVVKGSGQGTATDIDGQFALENIDENAVLVISYIGYQTQEVSVAGRSNITITLLSDSQLLDEVVVIGYGTQRRRDLTGAVSSINAEDIARTSSS